MQSLPLIAACITLWPPPSSARPTHSTCARSQHWGCGLRSARKLFDLAELNVIRNCRGVSLVGKYAVNYCISSIYT